MLARAPVVGIHGERWRMKNKRGERIGGFLYSLYSAVYVREGELELRRREFGVIE